MTTVRITKSLYSDRYFVERRDARRVTIIGTFASRAAAEAVAWTFKRSA